MYLRPSWLYALLAAASCRGCVHVCGVEKVPDPFCWVLCMPWIIGRILIQSG